jgi:hypothetical protein
MLWWDEDEQWEWAALLPKEGDSDDISSHDESAWVDFESAFGRRSSASSACSDKSVDALLDELEELVSTIGTDAGAGAGGHLEAFPPRCVLTVPRPRARGAKGQGSAYLFPVELAQNNKHTKSVLSPSTTSFGARRAKGAARRRRAGPRRRLPSPLHPHSAHGWASSSSASPGPSRPRATLSTRAITRTRTRTPSTTRSLRARRSLRGRPLLSMDVLHRRALDCRRSLERWRACSGALVRRGSRACSEALITSYIWTRCRVWRLDTVVMSVHPLYC